MRWVLTHYSQLDIHGNGASLMAQQVKNPPAMQETQDIQVWSLGWEDPLEEEMVIFQYSCLENPKDRVAWRLQSMGLHPVFLPGKSQGQSRLKATVHGAANSMTGLRASARMHTHTHTHTHRIWISICKWGPKQLSKWPEITQLRIWLRFIGIQIYSLGHHFVWIKEKLISYGFPWWFHGKTNKQIHLPMQDTWVWSLGWEDPLEEEMATHPSILALGNSVNRGAWWATIHGVAKSWTWLSGLSTHAYLL